jgi:hypothetical protein
MEQEIKEKLTPRVLKKYVPKTLTATQRKKQIQSILEGTDRPKLDIPRRKSKWTILAHKYFGESPSLEDISKKINVPVKGLQEIVDKGRGAYYSSGSRPNQTKESWGVARLYAVLFGSPGARRVDKKIIDEYNIPVLKLSGTGKIEEPDFLIKKDFPENFDKQVVSVINDLSMTNGKEMTLQGSMSFRSMLYANDYDLYEIVDYPNIHTIIKKFQDVIKRLLKRKDCFIGDIKCGSIEDWKVIDENGKYNAEKSREKVKELYEKGVITEDEKKEGLKLLVENPTETQLQQIMKMLRFNIIRWKPKDILNKRVKVRNGLYYHLYDALQSPAVCKVDCIILLENGIFEEFSCIYEIRVKGIRKNLTPVKPEETLLKDIDFYGSIGNWFKVAKRIFALANYRFGTQKQHKGENVEIMEKLYSVLNSDLGIIYNIIEDINGLLYLIENEKDLPIKRIKDEIEGFIERLSNVYSVNQYLKKEPKIIRDIHLIVSGRFTPERVGDRLEEIQDILSGVLSNETHKRLKELDLI